MSPLAPSKTLRPGLIEDQISQYLPSLKSVADVDIETPFNLDSSNIGPRQWQQLYHLINTHQANYDGFVLIHGTDTLVYTAAALSFLLPGLTKPVILTGSQRPLSAIRSDARGNLINAVELATRDIPEVAVCFNDKLYRGNRTKKMSTESYHGFISPNYPALATIGLNLGLRRQYFRQPDTRIILNPEFNTRILSLAVFPGMNFKSYIPAIGDAYHAIILAGFGAGNLPNSDPDWIQFIADAVARGILVAICSQSPHGTVDLDLYECGRQAGEAGALSLHDMTLEASIVKLMLLQGNFSEPDKIKSLLNKSIAGELTEADAE